MSIDQKRFVQVEMLSTTVSLTHPRYDHQYLAINPLPGARHFKLVLKKATLSLVDHSA